MENLEHLSIQNGFILKEDLLDNVTKSITLMGCKIVDHIDFDSLTDIHLWEKAAWTDDPIYINSFTNTNEGKLLRLICCKDSFMINEWIYHHDDILRVEFVNCNVPTINFS